MEQDLLALLGALVVSTVVAGLSEAFASRKLRAVEGYIPRPERAEWPALAFDLQRGERTIEVLVERTKDAWRHGYVLALAVPRGGLAFELRSGSLDAAGGNAPQGEPVPAWPGAPERAAIYTKAPLALREAVARPGFSEALQSLARHAEGEPHLAWSLRVDETGLRFWHRAAGRRPHPRELLWTTQTLLFLAPLLEEVASAAGPAPTGEARAEACPRCETRLLPAHGLLHESVCPGCAGRFLPQAAAERLVEQELGIDRETLGELVRHFAGERRVCPGCETKMSPVRLKGTGADLCTGCGGLWLDAGALTRISAGRYGEIQAG